MKNKPPEKKLKFARLYTRISGRVTRLAGSPVVTISAFLIVILWAVSGPFFRYSNTWQLVINTGTTIITFLMVFIIQQSQNRDTAAIQLKLNELISSDEKASNRLVDTEDLTEEELRLLKKFYVKISAMAKEENDIHSSHSLDEATDNHQAKTHQRSQKRKKRNTQ